MKAFSSIGELPGGIDLAVIILPASPNPQAIRDCAGKGIKAIVLAAGGFSEVDEKGEELQQDLIKAVRENGVRVIGPNTSGHTSTPQTSLPLSSPRERSPREYLLYRPDRKFRHPYHEVHRHGGKFRRSPGHGVGE